MSIFANLLCWEGNIRSRWNFRSILRIIRSIYGKKASWKFYHSRFGFLDLKSKKNQKKSRNPPFALWILITWTAFNLFWTSCYMPAIRICRAYITTEIINCFGLRLHCIWMVSYLPFFFKIRSHRFRFRFGFRSHFFLEPQVTISRVT
jgi:hypothetical protein